MLRLYTWFAFLGLMVLQASLLMGFRHDPAAPAINYAFNAGLYLAYMAVHYIMMAPWFKKLVSGDATGSDNERRLYIFVAITTWVAVYYLHFPVPGPAYVSPQWLVYIGYCAFQLSFIAYVEGATFLSLGGMLGVPGSYRTHTTGSETKLMVKGSYASVRHPMYRGAVFLGLSSLLLHPNVAQLFWIAMIGATFISFIPIEEKQLLKARGDEYRAYMEVTRYRLIKGIW